MKENLKKINFETNLLSKKINDEILEYQTILKTKLKESENLKRTSKNSNLTYIGRVGSLNEYKEIKSVSNYLEKEINNLNFLIDYLESKKMDMCDIVKFYERKNIFDKYKNFTEPHKKMQFEESFFKKILIEQKEIYNEIKNSRFLHDLENNLNIYNFDSSVAERIDDKKRTRLKEKPVNYKILVLETKMMSIVNELINSFRNLKFNSLENESILIFKSNLDILKLVKINLETHYYNKQQLKIILSRYLKIRKMDLKYLILTYDE